MAVVAVLGVILAYRYINPPYSTLMVANALAGRTLKHKWVKLEDISPYLVSAVVTSEDARFCRHWGVDWAEVEEAIEDAEDSGRGPRGASTIPMQTVKNLFLWQSRSYVRKAIEIPLGLRHQRDLAETAHARDLSQCRGMGPRRIRSSCRGAISFSQQRGKIDHGARRRSWQLRCRIRMCANAGRPGPKTRRLARKMERRLKSGGAPLDCIYPN